MPRWSALLLLVTAALTASACRSRLTGNEGNLAFSYESDDRVNDFNKPIAVGGRLDLRVEDAGSLRPVIVESAQSDAPAVLEVVATRDSHVTVEGRSAGAALLSVTAMVSGSTLPDSVNLLVAVPEILRMRHYCTAQRTGLYFVGQRIGIPFDLEKKNGQPVIGYGYHPIEVDPPEALTLDATLKSQAHFFFDAAASPLTAILRSTIDDSTLEFRLVTEAQVNGIALDAVVGVAALKADRKELRLVRPTVDGQPVCQGRAEMVVAGQTPEVCAVSAVPTAREDDRTVTSWGWVEIDAQAAGTCTFKVTYPNGADRQGVARSFSLEVR